MKMYVNEVMIRHWIGSDHDTKEEMLKLLAQLVNGEYSVEDFRNDVLDLWEGTL